MLNSSIHSDTLLQFQEKGYQILEELNTNLHGGRVTYKALHSPTNTLVVIKQFRFLTDGSWAAYQQVEREMSVLKNLQHDGIPRYLTQLDLVGGFCVVQEYKSALDLLRTRSFSPEEIKSIAIQLLEILIYLQQRIPIVIHRDIKPENILVDERLNVYLVDFGFARIGGENLALSSTVAGTTGFMAPEQLLNQTLTESSDLYGLGATLICLLTGLKSAQLSSLVNYGFEINFQHLVARYSFRFVGWLEKMVRPDPKSRFRSAREALVALKPLDVTRHPEIVLEEKALSLVLDGTSPRICSTLTIDNPIAETILEGNWSVARHLGDPDEPWIQVRPATFKLRHQTSLTCEILVDTTRLRTGKSYRRTLVIESNAATERIEVPISIHPSTENVEMTLKYQKTTTLLYGASSFFLSFVFFLVLFLPMVGDLPQETRLVFTLTTSGGSLWGIFFPQSLLLLFFDREDRDRFKNLHLESDRSIRQFFNKARNTYFPCLNALLITMMIAMILVIGFDGTDRMNPHQREIFLGGLLGYSWISVVISPFLTEIQVAWRKYRKYSLLSGGLGLFLALAILTGFAPFAILGLMTTGILVVINTVRLIRQKPPSIVNSTIEP